MKTYIIQATRFSKEFIKVRAMSFYTLGNYVIFTDGKERDGSPIVVACFFQPFSVIPEE